jgi:hypothetical protein
MQANLYSSSVIVFGRGLTGLASFVRKGELWAVENGIKPESLLEARLITDMLPLRRQIQIVCDFAVKAPSRVLDLPVRDDLDGEMSLAELHAAIAEARKFLDELKAEQFEGRDEAPVTFPLGPDEMTLPAAQYLLGFATQNFFFHLVTAYGILRKEGVPLGKRDFFGMPGA